MQSDGASRSLESVNKIRHHVALLTFKSEQHLRSFRICFDETETVRHELF